MDLRVFSIFREYRIIYLTFRNNARSADDDKKKYCDFENKDDSAPIQRISNELARARRKAAKGELATRVNLRVSPTFFHRCPRLRSVVFFSALIYCDCHCKNASERGKVCSAVPCENSSRFSHFPRETSTPL